MLKKGLISVAKINKHIEIVRSNTPGISSMSKKSSAAIAVTLSKYYASVGISNITNESDLTLLISSRPDLVFLGMKFLPTHTELGVQDPDKIWISSYLDEFGIAYTGSTQMAHQLESNKPMAKQRVIDAGLKTSEYFVVEQDHLMESYVNKLKFPVFIKPTNRGGGQGIDSNSVAYTQAEMRSKVKSIAADYKADSLIEEYLPGREFSVAVLKDDYTDKFLVMPIEKIAPKDLRGKRILSGQIKSADVAQDLLVTDDTLKQGLMTFALNVFHALCARDYGRIDIRLDQNGNPHFLEANLIPSLIENYGSFPKSCMLNMGLDYETMILRIVELGLMRSASAGQDDFEPSAENYNNMPLAVAA